MRGHSLALALLTLTAAGPSSAASTRRPAIERFWSGLGPAQESAEARPGIVLQTPLPDRVRIPGGHFMMGSTPLAMHRALSTCRRETLRARCDAPDVTGLFRAEGEAHSVGLDPYDLDRTEVTVEVYGRCVSSGACPPPSFAAGDARFDRPGLPVVLVAWEDARAFCAFAGGRLPTEAEWEFAARGPRGREFPWGEIYNPRVTNHGSFAHDPADETDGFAGLAPVGAFPDDRTPEGIVDLAGNAAEWVADYYDVNEQRFGYPPMSIVNPKGPANGTFHVVRGGSYGDGAAWLRGATRGTGAGPSRFYMIPEPRSAYVGFRCAYDVRREL